MNGSVIDIQHLIDGALTIFIAALGWFARELWSMIQDIRADLEDFKQVVPQRYVPKDEYREDVRDMKGKLDDILKTLSEKADRPRDR